MVKRYTWTETCFENGDVKWCQSADVAALEAELAEAKGKLETCMAWGEVTKKRLERELAALRERLGKAEGVLGEVHHLIHHRMRDTKERIWRMTEPWHSHDVAAKEASDEGK